MKYKSLLTPKEAAKQLMCTTGTLANWRTKEIGPCFAKMPNGRIYYTQQSIDKYLHEHQQYHTVKNTRLVPLSVIMSVRAGCGINMV